MKKVLLLIITIIIIITIIFTIIIQNDYQNNIKLYNQIDKHTSITNIDYINHYDNYYLVNNDEYLYILDDKYKEILKVDNILIHKNKNNYEIIYKDGKALYLNDYIKGTKLYYEYYDLYTYELIDKIVIGG